MYPTINGTPQRHGYEDTEHHATLTGFHSKLGEGEATRAYSVRVVCDGKRTAHLVTGGTVQDVLDQADIVLDQQDKVDIPLDQQVQEGDTITVTRKKTVIREEEIALPYKTVVVPTSLLAPDKKQLLVEGEAGLRVDTYTQRVVNGIAEQEQLKSEQVVKEPVDRQVLVGTAGHPISPLDFECEFDENGEPVGYQQVLREQRAAGYSARAGARTASGRAAVVGTVAVDPNVIPYGSKLYIESTDGKFVYGYAVAADTGTAIAQGVIAVDLFYGSYQESALNGIKYVDIYILE